MRRSVSFAAAVVLLLVARFAGAQETFSSLGGPWWFTLSGKDSGALLLEFSDPNGGTFTLEDVPLNDRPSFGFSTAVGDFFQIAADQALGFDAKGNVIGSLVLNAEGGGPVATLTLTKGKPNKTFTKLKLSGTLDAGMGPLAVKLTGVRPSDFPVLTGETDAGGLSGGGAKSKTMTLGVMSDADLGLPAYTIAAHGPVEIDKVPVADSALSCRVMVDPKFKLHGLMTDSTDFGTGPAKGSLKLPSKAATTPKLSASLAANRKLKLKGTLTDPVEPVLKVTPISADYGASHLGDVHTKLFAVTNVGVGALSGEVSFVTDTTDFALIGSPTYVNLQPGDAPVNIAVAFQPDTEGSKSATLRFGTLTSIGSKLVTVKGSGGIAEIMSDHTFINFADTAANTTRSVTVTISNAGDGTLSGRARITGSGTFVLIQPPNTVGVTQINYTLAPGDTKQFDVRFGPTSAGDFSATLNLTGGRGLDVPLTGSGF